MSGPPGDTGSNALIRLDAEMPGLNCVNGGTAVHAGVDRDDDGVLDNEEIQGTSYVCSEELRSICDVLHGDLLLTNSLDVARFADAGCTEISGNLTITGGLDSLLGLESLTVVRGRLDIARANALTSMNGLDNLTSVGDVLEIRSNAALASLDGLESLTSVHHLSIVSNSLTSLAGLASLAAVEGTLIISQNISLSSLSGLEGITSVNNVEVSFNGALTDLGGLGGIAFVVGNLHVWRNASLTSLDGLDGISAVGGNLEIAYNDALANLRGLASLDELGGNLTIGGNGSLSQCEADWLAGHIGHIGGSVSTYGNGDIERCMESCGDLRCDVGGGECASCLTDCGGTLACNYCDGLTCRGRWELDSTDPVSLGRSQKVAAAGSRIYFAREAIDDSRFFKSIETAGSMRTVRTETLMSTAANDFCNCGLASQIVPVFHASASAPTPEGFSLYYFANYGQAYGATDRTWRPEPYPSTSHRGEAAVAAVGSKIYFVGGRGTPVLTSVEYYDTVSRSWSPTSDYPAQVQRAQATSHNGLLYVVGGDNGTTEYRLFYSFNPNTNAWTRLVDAPETGVTRALVFRDKIWALFVDHFRIFDPVGGAWSDEVAIIPPDLAFAHPVVTNRGDAEELYLVAGNSTTNTFFYRYVDD